SGTGAISKPMRTLDCSPSSSASASAGPHKDPMTTATANVAPAVRAVSTFLTFMEILPGIVTGATSAPTHARSDQMSAPASCKARNAGESDGTPCNAVNCRSADCVQESQTLTWQ